MLARITVCLVTAFALGFASVVPAKPASSPRTAPYSGLPNHGFGCDPDYGPNGYNPCAYARR